MRIEESIVGEEIFQVGGGDPFSQDLITQAPKEIEAKTVDAPEKSNKDGEASGAKSKEAPKAEEIIPPNNSTEVSKETKKSNAAQILAESFKKDGILPEDYKIGENISAKDLKVALMETAQKEAEELLRSEYESKYNPETLKTADLISKGIRPEDVSEINFYKRLSNARVGEDEDENIKVKEFVIREMYKDKGVKESKIEKLIESAIDEDEGEEEFAEAKKHFSEKAKEYEDNLNDSIKKAEDADRKKQESVNKELKLLIKSGEIYNTTDADSQKKLESFLFDQNETVKIDGKPYKVTGFQKALEEYNKDLKKQLTFAKLLQNGFDLASIEEGGKVKAADELDNLLEAQISGKLGMEKEKEIHSGFSFNDAMMSEIL